MRFVLSVVLVLFVGAPVAEAHIFGSKNTNFYIRITPLRASQDLKDEGSFAKYEWCRFHFDDESALVVTDACQPLGKPNAYYSIGTFEPLFDLTKRNREAQQRLEKVELLTGKTIEVLLLFVGSAKIAQVAMKATVETIPAILAQHYGKKQLIASGVILFAGYDLGWQITDGTLQAIEQMTAWSIERMSKNNTRLITTGKKRTPAYISQLIFNPLVLSGQGENSDMVDENAFALGASILEEKQLTLDWVRTVIQAYLKNASSTVRPVESEHVRPPHRLQDEYSG